MTLGSAGALVVLAGLAATLCSRGEPRPATGDSVVPDSAVDTAGPARVPPESAVRRPPIMDPAPKERPPRLPRPDTAGPGT